MACCCVEMQGKDGKTHTLKMDASSSFDAVGQAVNAWVKLWWYDPNAVMVGFELAELAFTLLDPRSQSVRNL